MLLYCLVKLKTVAFLYYQRRKPISVSKLSPIAEGRRNYNAIKTLHVSFWAAGSSVVYGWFFLNTLRKLVRSRLDLF